ncbi:MAG: M43 family zinc metalloprotease [Bacteroidota bacterium]|nr:M43 family zinc metalloprotease [Bacteroidota bacterium]
MRHIFSLALLLLCLNVNGQGIIYSPFPEVNPTISGGNPPGCVTDILSRQKELADPAYHQRMQNMNLSIRSFLNAANSQQTVQSVLSIPVVVHIIHNNGPENISNAMVLQGIQDLNDAFANAGSFADVNGVNTNIQFCLAQQDENGNASIGINRVVSSLTNLTAETDDATLKNLIRWDPTKYLNIWLVNEITSLSMGSGVAGYAYLPSSHGNPEDGIVNEARWFGSDPNNSKIHIHEAGHYLGLYHTFEAGCTNNNCQVDGDLVCDTPPDNSTAATSCTFTPNSCTTDDDDLSANNPFRPAAQGGSGDQPDMIENYMDYGFQYCQLFFSAGQSARMTAALSTTRASLLQSIGCNSLCPNPITIGFNTSASVILAGGTVNFTNTTTPASTYSWELNGVPMASSANYSQLFTTPGTYTITLIATNGDPSCDKTLDQIVTVLCQAQASFTMSPAGPYSPGANITFTSTSTGATTYQWIMDGVPQATATSFNYTFNPAGGHSVYLVVSNGQCSDTSNVEFFEIGQCGSTHITDHWFIPGTSIDFTSGSPVIGASPINTNALECTSTISDANGNLLFYTDGISVWNRNNVVMANGSGLMSHASSTQGVLITPYPGSSNLYYIFTSGAIENSYANGLRYSVVDMTLNAGFGDVTAIKNVLLMPGMGEKTTATWHSNGTDIWLATHSTAGNTFYAFLISASGINTTAVTSNIGMSCDMGLGSMRFSHNGTHVAAISLTNSPPRFVVYANFNATTGVFFNPMNLTLSSSTWEQPYCVEFSPDNSKLYSTLVNFGQVYQWDLTAGSESAINATIVGVDTYSGLPNFGHLTLAPNGIIYVAGQTFSTLDAIMFPNLAGAACNYVAGALPINTNSGWALPNMMPGINGAPNPAIAGPSTICTGQQSYTYLLANRMPGDSAIWSHSGVGNLQSSTDTSAVLVSGNSAGNDTLFTTTYGVCGVTRDTMVIETAASPVISFGNDTALCATTILVPGYGYASYLWQNTSVSSTLLITTPGTYWVHVIDSSGCAGADTIIFSADPNLAPVNLGSDVTVCLNHTTVLNAGNGYSTYTWQNGWTGQTFTAYTSGTYWVTVTGPCYTGTDTITVIADESSIPLDLGNDTTLCAAAFPFTLTAPAGYPDYSWQDSSTTSNFSVTAFGLYWVTITDSNGCSAQDTIEVINCVSVGSIEWHSNVSIYPNPVNEFFTIDIAGGQASTVLLYNSFGELVFEKQLVKGATREIIQTSGFADGMYIVEIRSGENRMHDKIVVVH